MASTPELVPRVTIRPEKFTREALAARGIRSMTAAADACGLPKTTMSRVVTGATWPGERFIAAVLTGLPPTPEEGDAPKFEDLFVIRYA